MFQGLEVFVHVNIPGIARICNGPARVSALYSNGDMGRLKGIIIAASASSWAYLYDFPFRDMIVAVLLLP